MIEKDQRFEKLTFLFEQLDKLKTSPKFLSFDKEFQ